jgi:hypothetical protein
MERREEDNHAAESGSVIPAKARMVEIAGHHPASNFWIPAFAGMTTLRSGFSRRKNGVYQSNAGWNPEPTVVRLGNPAIPSFPGRAESTHHPSSEFPPTWWTTHPFVVSLSNHRSA